MATAGPNYELILFIQLAFDEAPVPAFGVRRGALPEISLDLDALRAQRLSIFMQKLQTYIIWALVLTCLAGLFVAFRIT